MRIRALLAHRPIAKRCRQFNERSRTNQTPRWAGLSESQLLSARKRLLGTHRTPATEPRRSQKIPVSPAPTPTLHAKRLQFTPTGEPRTVSDVQPSFRRPHFQDEDGEQKQTTQWFAVGWGRRTFSPELDRGPSRLLQASAKGGLWHQYISAQARNKLVSFAYRLTVHTHSSEAPEVGGERLICFTCGL